MVALTYVGILPSRIDHKNHEGNFIGKAYSYQEIKGEVTDDKVYNKLISPVGCKRFGIILIFLGYLP
jgi:hypothetical protein